MFETMRNRLASFPRAVDEREVLLVLLHREHQAFLRHFQERLLEMRLVHSRELDQRGHLVVERLLRGDRRPAPGGGLELLAYLARAELEVRDHLAVALEQCLVVVGARDLDRALAQEPVPARRAAARFAEHGPRDDAVAVQQHQAAHRPHEFLVAVAPAHHLRDRQLLQRGLDQPRERRVEPRAVRDRAEREHFLFAVVDALEPLDRHALLLRETEQRLRRGPVGAETRLHRRSLREHLAVRRLRRDVASEHAEPSRRRVHREASIGRREPFAPQAGDERVGERIAERAQRLRRQLLGEELDEQRRLHCAAFFSIGKPSRSRDS